MKLGLNKRNVQLTSHKPQCAENHASIMHLNGFFDVRLFGAAKYMRVVVVLQCFGGQVDAQLFQVIHLRVKTAEIDRPTQK